MYYQLETCRKTHTDTHTHSYIHECCRQRRMSLTDAVLPLQLSCLFRFIETLLSLIEQ